MTEEITNHATMAINSPRDCGAGLGVRAPGSRRRSGGAETGEGPAPTEQGDSPGEGRRAIRLLRGDAGANGDRAERLPGSGGRKGNGVREGTARSGSDAG